MPYVLLQIREGDMISLRAMTMTRQGALHCMFNVMNTGGDPTSWWKVLQVDDVNVEEGNPYDVVVDVHWETSNRARIIGVYPVGHIPNNIRQNARYFAETLNCTR